MFKELTIDQFQEKLSSSEPVPGGGSLAAISGSLACSLAEMFINLTLEKEKYAEDHPLFSEAKGKVIELKEKLIKLADEDASAFDKVMQAFKLPKGTDEEKAKRKEAIAKAFLEAAEVPRKTASSAIELLRILGKLAEGGNPNAISDLGVASLTAYSALIGALLNVRINLPSIKDEDYVEKASTEADALEKEGNELKDRILAKVKERIG
ncbi:MAG: cyclodeaminase/cyclohydrolase family protein [Acidobacteria bacterium]|nr:cyclodeaminase/cyclohydrolase family protein [Acidobacteriota bacterium]